MGPKSEWNRRRPIPPKVRKLCEHLATKLIVPAPRPMVNRGTPIDTMVFTDASEEAWGAVVYTTHRGMLGCTSQWMQQLHSRPGIPWTAANLPQGDIMETDLLADPPPRHLARKCRCIHDHSVQPQAATPLGPHRSTRNAEQQPTLPSPKAGPRLDLHQLPCLIPSHMRKTFVTNGAWTSRQRQLHITAKEALAASYGICLTIQEARPKRLLVVTDSAATQSTLAKGSAAWKMNWAVQSAIQRMEALNIQMSAAWVASELNPADKPSRDKTYGTEDWKLHPQTFHWASKMLNVQPTVDLFASLANRQCALFYSERPQPEAVATNCLNINWGALQDQGQTLYANPPFSLLHRVLEKVQAETVHPIMLIVPHWPGMAWWPILESLKDDVTPAPHPQWITEARLVGGRNWRQREE
eukprot:TRINITY_DN1130_c0_g1_i18.p2 TRINITY_DN1130_c0_g1~~TRINITY_DN1130_c0_g1_i18.p2  ORF type:complete len:412 (-),score=30.99 TRINITY_DN1130_c0_g1_i18:2438-3673(-)